MTGYDLDWLQALIAQYDQEHDWDSDPDPSSTQTMLCECRTILAELRPEHPKCSGCMDADAETEGGLCRQCSARNIKKKDEADQTIPF